MAIHFRTDHPLIQDFKKRRELEALELDLRLREARIKTAELVKHEAKLRARLKRMEAKASEERKCAAVILERKDLNANSNTQFPTRAEMLAEIKSKHSELTELTVKSRAFVKAWKPNAPDDAHEPGKKPRG